jgi:hypothetical protein
MLVESRGGRRELVVFVAGFDWGVTDGDKIWVALCGVIPRSVQVETGLRIETNATMKKNR